jgi:prepilin-type N-terminal cleavage/methylation domain-containing protein
MSAFLTSLEFPARTRRARSAGFTLIEFLIAMLLFVIIGGATFSMFAKNAPYFNQQQNTAALNISLQNAVSQLQLDLVNAGTGYYPGTVIPSWPIGVTIINQNPTSACNTPATYSYSASCFDTLNILTINTNIPPSHPTNSAGNTASTACSTLTTADSQFYLVPNAGQTVAQTAANFKSGDQVILVKAGGGGSATQGPTSNGSTAASGGAQYNSFAISATPIQGANYVALPFASPSTSGVMNDPLGISTSSTNNLGTSFCTADWVMKLEPTTYQIDAGTPSDPKLDRVHGGNTDIIAEQIIGFKVGATTWVTNGLTSTTTYNFNASAAAPNGYSNNFPLIRSVRVTLLGRTNPNPDPTYVFRNTFDGGPYQVQDATVVIDPRNLTMNGN